MTHPVRFLGSFLLILVFGIGSAQAQITIVESDLRASLGRRIAIQQVNAVNPSNFASLFNQDGGNQVFDFTPFEYDAQFGGIQERQPIGDAPSGVPFLNDFESRGATIVGTLRLNATDPTDEDSTAWTFENLSSDGFSFYGASFLFDQDVDGDGDSPDSVAIQYNPALQLYPLPLTVGDTWSQDSELSFLPDFGLSTQESWESEVDGWGTLVTPAGSVPVLRVRTVMTDTIEVPGAPPQVSQTTDVTFVAKDFTLVASILRDDDSGDIISASYTVLARAGASFEVAQNETPTFFDEDLGTEVRFTNGSSTAGMIDVSRYDTAPFNNTFTGSATSDDGTTVTPNTAWMGAYFEVRNQGLQGFTADFCVDISNVPGVSDAGTLLLGKRETSNDPWTAVNSVLDGDFLCATGVSSFSQFAVVSDGTSNPLPVELASFSATADGRDAVLQWQTASETNNGGFHVEHRTDREGWTDVEFVEGAGTTAEPQRYQLRVSDLDVGTHTFRLRQVDLDGSTHLSDEVTVRIRPETALFMSDVRPHPVRSQADLVLMVRDQQHVSVDVFDLLGRRVKQVHDGVIPAGTERHLQLDVSDLPSGLYLIRATSAKQQITRRVTVVR